MPDPRFYRRAGPFSLADLAGRCGARLAPGADADRVIKDVGTIDTATAGDIVYFADPSYVVALAASQCGACVTTAELAAHVSRCPVLLAADPRGAYAEIAALFYPETSPTVAQSGNIASDAVLAADAVIAPGAVIGAGAAIGARTVIGANAVIGPGVVIGHDCRIGANTTLSYCLVGNRVILHPGVQIGQDGFGFVPTPGGHRKVPQLGRVLIRDDVEIGANSAVDRGVAGDTVIGAGTKIDNLVQIAHNVVIGKHCLIVAQVGISGSTHLGNRVTLAGQVGVAGHLEIEDRVVVSAQSGVSKTLEAGGMFMGSPAVPAGEYREQVAYVRRLHKLTDRVQKLEQRPS